MQLRLKGRLGENNGRSAQGEAMKAMRGEEVARKNAYVINFLKSGLGLCARCQQT